MLGDQEGRLFNTYLGCCRSVCSAVGICWRPSSGPPTSTAPPGRPDRADRSANSVALAARAHSVARRFWLLPGGTDDLANSVDFVFGLARNRRLVGEIGAELAQAEAQARRTGKPARRFKDFSYSTLDTCRGALGVVGATTAIQLRPWFSSFPMSSFCAVRRIGLRHTQFVEAPAGTIRLKLFKIGALVKASARRIKFALPTACPYANEWPAAACTSPARPLFEASPQSTQSAATPPEPTGDRDNPKSPTRVAQMAQWTRAPLRSRTVQKRPKIRRCLSALKSGLADFPLLLGNS